MKKIIKNIATIFLMTLFFSFFSASTVKAQEKVSAARPQKTISYKITNKGSKSISFSQRNNKDNNIGAVVYKLDGGKKQANEGKLGNKIVVECNGKKQIFILGETKENDFTVNCN